MSSRSPDLSPADVRLLVSLVPRDCVPALVELRRHGLLQDDGNTLTLPVEETRSTGSG